jgi:uncharacterized protein YcnI
VQFPPGFEFVSYEPRPGWRVTTKGGSEVDEITWTGDGKQGVIAPGQFVDFGLSLKMPDGNAGDKLTFKALQTYDDGEVVRWIGPEDAEEPAPTVILTAASAAGDQPASSQRAEEPAGADGGDGLAIAALVVGALALVAGVAALLTTRRSRVTA